MKERNIIKGRLVLMAMKLKTQRQTIMNDEYIRSGEMRYQAIKTIDSKLQLIEDIKHDIDKHFTGLIERGIIDE